LRYGRIVLVSVVTLTGCSGSTDLDPPYDPTGTWIGEWTGEDGAASGELRLEFSLEPNEGGASQRVLLKASGLTCSPEGDSGEGAYSAEPASVSFFVRVRDASSPSSEDSGISFSARVSGGRLEGSYTTAAFGGCSFCGCDWGARGSWSAARSR
jgi:hypothetical protein